MSSPKTYLNVPYAQKDAAKALGARWDATQKKWYVPDGKDRALFAQWSIAAESSAAVLATPAAKTAAKLPANIAGGPRTAAGVLTYPTIADFVPYSGEAPPWE